MKTTTVICAGCGVSVEKTNGTVNRARKQGIQLFCSHSCAMKTRHAKHRENYIAPLEKPCSHCHIVKPLTDFHLNPATLDGRQGHCKSCNLIYVKEWQKRKPEKHKTWYHKYKYGLTSEMEAKFLDKQNGVCAICGTSPPQVVDHCHNTRAVRGLLCNSCNIGLGLFGDNVNNLLRAIAYLKQPPLFKPPKKKRRRKVIKKPPPQEDQL